MIFGSNIITLARKKHNRTTMHQHWGVVKTSKRNRNSERVSEQADVVCCFDPFSFSSDPLECQISVTGITFSWVHVFGRSHYQCNKNWANRIQSTFCHEVGGVMIQ